MTRRSYITPADECISILSGLRIHFQAKRFRATIEKYLLSIHTYFQYPDTWAIVKVKPYPLMVGMSAHAPLTDAVCFASFS